MPHTTTKTMRSKRPDTRPNGKQRLKIARKIEAEKVIQDLRVTRKQKGEKRFREAQILPLKNPNEFTDDEKYVRNLKKKLRAIDELMTKQRSGTELDEQQLEKVAKLPMLLEEMDAVLLKVASAAVESSRDDDDR